MDAKHSGSCGDGGKRSCIADGALHCCPGGGDAIQSPEGKKERMLKLALSSSIEMSGQCLHHQQADRLAIHTSCIVISGTSCMFVLTLHHAQLEF